MVDLKDTGDILKTEVDFKQKETNKQEMQVQLPICLFYFIFQ